MLVGATREGNERASHLGGAGEGGEGAPVHGHDDFHRVQQLVVSLHHGDNGERCTNGGGEMDIKE